MNKVPNLQQSDPIFFKFVNSLFYHWENYDLKCTLTEIKNNIESENIFYDGKYYHYNPFRDIIFSIAFYEKMVKATSYYCDTITPLLKRIAHSMLDRDEDIEDTCSEFYIKLVGNDTNSAAILHYPGTLAFTLWVRMIFRNFVKSALSKK